MIPVGSGLTLKAGKFVTLLGYEVTRRRATRIFSRSFLFTFAIPVHPRGQPWRRTTSPTG